MKSYEEIRFYAIWNIIDSYDAAERFGDHWYQFNDQFFASMRVYHSIGAVSDEEDEMSFKSLNHCRWNDCNDDREYFRNLLEVARKELKF